MVRTGPFRRGNAEINTYLRTFAKFNQKTKLKLFLNIKFKLQTLRYLLKILMILLKKIWEDTSLQLIWQ